MVLMYRRIGVFLVVAQPAWAQVVISPAYMQMQPGQTLQFTASGGPVLWQVNNAIGGTAASGTITAGGLFTAPASLPSPAAVTVTAVAAGNSVETSTATITLLAQPPAGGTYYVATTGSDSNPGSSTAPFATLQHAASVTQPGDTVLVRQGTYNQLLTPTTSGNTAQGPITFESYPGELATIDGSGLPIPNGQNGLVTLNGLSSIIIQGLQLQNYSTTSIRQVPVGVYLTGAGTGVQIINNHIHDIITTAKTTPKKCGSDALGMAIYGSEAPASISGLVISGNEVDDLQTGCSESISVNGNVDGYAVTNNLVHDNDNIGIDSEGFEKVSPNPAYDQARNGEIRGNVVYNISSYGNPDYGKQYAADGIYVDGGTQITIEQNIVHNTDLGMELASEHHGRVTSYVTARNNLVYFNNSTGISIGGYGKARGGTDHCTIVNNTLLGNDTKNTGSGEFQIQFYATNNIFQNNIVYSTAQALFVHNFTNSDMLPATLDNNLYFGGAGAGTAIFQWNKSKFKGFASYQAATGQDASSAFADPLFQNLTLPELDIQAGSPAFAAGADLGANVIGRFDIAGNPRVANGDVTIGAYQQ
jgi:hypothetical protein